MSGADSRSCTRRRRASAASTSASCRAQGGLDAAAMAQAGALDVLFLLGGRRDRDRARRLHDLHRHARRPWRGARRRRPAGRLLHREVGHLRQHRGPRAARRPRQLPARRGARGLGDSSRALRGARQDAAVRFARRSARQALCRAPAHGEARPDRRGRQRSTPRRFRRKSRPRAVRLARRRLLPDQPDRPRLEGDGAGLGARAQGAMQQAAE